MAKINFKRMMIQYAAAKTCVIVRVTKKGQHSVSFIPMQIGG